MVAASTQSGPGPAELRDCHRCEGIGRVVGNRYCAICAAGEKRAHACSVCPVCEGARRLWYDPMLVETRPVDPPEHRPSTRTGEGAKARRRSSSTYDLADTADAWKTARERHEYATSRPELDRALEVLRDEDPIAHGLIQAAYVEKRYDDARGRRRIEESARWIIARGLVRLSQLMPDEIRLPLQLEEQMNGHNRAAQARRLIGEGLSRREASRRMGIRQGHLAALLRR